MAKDNLKKPENDNKVPLTEEEKDKRKKVIILIILIILVLAILIGTAYYFSRSGKEKDSDNDNKNNPGTIVNPSENNDDNEKPEPVVKETTTNNNVIVYRPVKKPVATPSEPEIPTTITGSEDDESISVEFDQETRTITLSGTSKYIAKVNENFGSGFNNIVQVKITLNSKYKLEDLSKMNFTVTTEVENGKKNYFLEDVQEDENGNLYFYWLQAVGKDLDLTPQLTINYGDGNIEVYTMDLSNILIQKPLDNAEDLAQALISTADNKVMVGGVELDLDYKITVLEEVSVKEDETEDDEIVDDNQENNSDEADKDDIETETKPVDKNYILKVTGIDKENNYYTEDAAIKLGFEGYKYIIAVKLYAPANFDETKVEDVKKTFTKSHVDGEGKITDSNNKNITMSEDTFVLYDDEVDLDGNVRYYIIVTMAVDGVYPGNNPYVSIDWDGDGNEHGTTRYIFDFSEFNYIEEPEDDVDFEVSETPKDSVQTENKGKDSQNSNDDDENSSSTVLASTNDSEDEESKEVETLVISDEDTDEVNDKKDDKDGENATNDEDTASIGEEIQENSETPETPVSSGGSNEAQVSEVNSRPEDYMDTL